MNGIKRQLRKIKWLHKIYYKLWGKRKADREVERKKQDLQNNGKELLLLVDKVLRAANIDYFADFGTLLGLIRDGGFLKWDWDLDFGLIIDNDEEIIWEKLESTLQSIGMKKIKTCSYEQHIIEQTYRYGVLTIDFFWHFRECDHDNAYLGYKKKGYKYDLENEYHVTKLVMYPFDGIIDFPIFDGNIRIPNNPEAYLASVYSEKWMIPDPNWVSEKGPAWNAVNNARAYAEYFN